jgi:hypothetical protein
MDAMGDRKREENRRIFKIGKVKMEAWKSGGMMFQPANAATQAFVASSGYSSGELWAKGYRKLDLAEYVIVGYIGDFRHRITLFPTIHVT